MLYFTDFVTFFFLRSFCSLAVVTKDLAFTCCPKLDFDWIWMKCLFKCFSLCVSVFCLCSHIFTHSHIHSIRSQEDAKFYVYFDKWVYSNANANISAWAYSILESQTYVLIIGLSNSTMKFLEMLYTSQRHQGQSSQNIGNKKKHLILAALAFIHPIV